MRKSSIVKRLAVLEGQLNAARLDDTTRAQLVARNMAKTYAPKVTIPKREIKGWRGREMEESSGWEPKERVSVLSQTEERRNKLEEKLAKLRAQLEKLAG